MTAAFAEPTGALRFELRPSGDGLACGRIHLSVSTWQQPQPVKPGPRREQVLRTVAERIASLGRRRLRVAIVGPTAAGKTILGHELAAFLAEGGRDVFRASLDDFKRPWSERHL